MDASFVLLLCIALLLTAKVDGESQVVSNSTDTQIVTDSKSIDHSSNTTHSSNTQLASDGSETKPSDGDGSTILKDKESESTKEEATRKKQGEECDPSYMCTDEQHQFLACLRVPGNDAPHLSLLIQNKAKSALLLTITAPSFVSLEKNKVQLLESQDTKVKVSVNKGGSNDSAVILTSSNGGRCSLDLKDFTTEAATLETGKDSKVAVSRSSILNISSRTVIVIIMISFLVTSLVIIPVIIHVCRNKSQGKSKYQRLDMELPVSNNALVSKSDQETGDDGWNNNWGDDWDDGDEEQPVLPLTPSVSSRGLAPRRLSKEGWKD